METGEITHINLAPTWGEFGRIFLRLAETGETGACRKLAIDAKKAFAAAATFNEIVKLLTPEQSQVASKILRQELEKLGVA